MQFLKEHLEVIVEFFRGIGERAPLAESDLRSADLESADLESADLFNADLRGADLFNANLRSANLRGANLRGADLESADLRGADLFNANLRSANLRGADLESADLESAKSVKSYGPVGETGRFIYAVRHPDCVKFQIGCEWVTAQEARDAIGRKYAPDGEHYEEYIAAIDLMEKSLLKIEVPTPVEVEDKAKVTESVVG